MSGSITDPSLSSPLEWKNKNQSIYKAIKGSFKTKITRNIRISADNFLKANRQDGLFDTLYVKNDLYLGLPVTSLFSFLQSISALEKMSLFAVLSYRRPLYASKREISEICWSAVLCFGDLNIGVDTPVLITKSFQASSSFYLNIPSSKNSFDKSLLMGVGASLSMNYIMLSQVNFQLSAISSHFVDLDWYLYEAMNAQSTYYNVPLNVFNQLGFKLHYSAYSYVPALFVYGGYNFALNFKGTPFHAVSLHTSAVWTIGKNTRISAGLNWGDRILKPKGTALVEKTNLLHPDHTFFSLGGSYSF